MKRIVVGISGASGVITGIRLLQRLHNFAEVHLIISRAAREVIRQETLLFPSQIAEFAASVYANDDLSAPIASGTFLTGGMVIAPCSIKTLAGIAHSYADTLMVRAADVTLKQRRPLVLAVRETPLHLGHLRLMTAIAENGGAIAPFMPAFYAKPESIDDLIHHWVGQVLDLLGLDHDMPSRYNGPEKAVSSCRKNLS